MRTGYAERRRGRRRVAGVVAATTVAAALVGTAVGCAPDAGDRDGARDRHATTPKPKPTSHPAPTLPRGGRTLFPAYRLVGYAGYPGAGTLGRLGTGDLDERLDEIERRYGAAYGPGGRRTLPVAELITVVVQGSPGKDRKFRNVVDDEVIERHLRAARRHHALLLLNIQPGRSDFGTEVRGLERWLTEPDVGVALDPEWAMDEGERPGATFGHTTGAELDSVAAYLSSVVRRNRLPEKAMVVHELAPRVVRDEERWRAHPGVAAITSVDGIGGRAAKEETWRRVLAGTPKHVRAGFKLFFDEDTEHGPLMTPSQVLALRPAPDYVLYE